MAQSSRLNIIAFLGKIGKPFFIILGKAFGVLAKVMKGAGATKVVLGVASFGAYSIMIDWKFAVCLLTLIGIHESGHVWAMRRLGMPTRGFYFIPFFGGAAVPESAFPSAWSEGYVALMGPLWGLGTSFIAFGIFYATGIKLFEVAACWMAFVNLLNLIPIYPFDGGRVLHAITRSIESRTILIVVLIISCVCIAVCGFSGYWIFATFGVLGIIEQFDESNTVKKNAELYGSYRTTFLQFMERLTAFFALPKDAPIETVLKKIQNLDRDNAVFTKPIRELRRLRIEYNHWESKWLKMFKRFEKKNTMHIDSIKTLPLFADNPNDAFEKLLLDAGKHAATPRKLNALVDQFHHIVRETKAIIPSLVTASEILLPHGIAIGNFSIGRLSLRQYLQHLCKKINTDEHVVMEEYADLSMPIVLLSASLFDRQTPYPSVLNDSIFFETKDYSAIENWLNGTYISLIIMASDQKSRARLIEANLAIRHVEFRMSPRSIFATFAAYTLLASLLFFFMQATGGHEAAKGAVEFFKKF